MPVFFKCKMCGGEHIALDVYFEDNESFENTRIEGSYLECPNIRRTVRYRKKDMFWKDPI